MSSVSSALSSLLGNSSSSSSLDLSSILQVLYGSSSAGIDVNSAVSAGLYAARAPERVWQSQQTTIANQQSALTNLNSAVSNLQTDLEALDSSTGAINSMTATSSNSSLVTASAASGTAAGSHVVVVNNLAATGSWYSNQVSGGLTAGSFSIQLGSGTAQTITVTAGETLSSLASDINTKLSGVTASVVTDSTGSRLAIVSNSSGAGNDIKINSTSGADNQGNLPSLAISSSDSSNTGLSLTEAVQGKDASATVDGIPVTSATNKITSVLSGVTLNLVGASSSTQVSVTVAPNSSSINAAVNQFVSDYNGIVSGLNSQFTATLSSDGSSASQGALAQDSAVRQLQSDLLTAGSYLGSDGATTLATLGISMKDDGTLEVNNSTLNDAIANKFSTVQNFFQGTASNGFANTLDTQLGLYTAAGSGAFTVDLQSLTTQYSSLTDEINDFENNYIASQQTILTNEYNKAETALQQLSSTQKQIDALLNNNSSGN